VRVRSTPSIRLDLSHAIDSEPIECAPANARAVPPLQEAFLPSLISRGRVYIRDYNQVVGSVRLMTTRTTSSSCGWKNDNEIFSRYNLDEKQDDSCYGDTATSAPFGPWCAWAAIAPQTWSATRTPLFHAAPASPSRPTLDTPAAEKRAPIFGRYDTTRWAPRRQKGEYRYVQDLSKDPEFALRRV
jgi:hypothetical protein